MAVRVRSGALCFTVVAAGCGGSSGSGVAPRPPPYTTFADARAVTITGYSGEAMEPFVSKDGRYLFFNNRNDPGVNTDLFYAARVSDQIFAFLGPVPDVNSAGLDAVASPR